MDGQSPLKMLIIGALTDFKDSYNKQNPAEQIKTIKFSSSIKKAEYFKPKEFKDEAANTPTLLVEIFIDEQCVFRRKDMEFDRRHPMKNEETLIKELMCEMIIRGLGSRLKVRRKHNKINHDKRSGTTSDKE